MAFPTKKDLQAAWQSLLQTLGFTDKVKKNEMTPEDWAVFGAAFEKEYEISIQAAFDETKTAPSGVDLTDQMKEEIQGSIKNAFENAGVDTPPLDLTSLGSTLTSILGAVESLGDKVGTMGAKQEKGTPIAIVGATQDASVLARVLGHSPHSTTHLFGVEESYFKRGTWWNELVATGVGKDDYRRDETAQFKAEFNNFCEDFKTHCAERVKNNQVGLLDYDKMIHGESFIDYSNVNTKLGEYTVRRFDLIIAYFRTLKSVGHIFPVVSNVQNETTAPTAYFGELSQSYLSGHHYKGSVQFDGEKYHVDDCMMKFAFIDAKDLEKSFVGYRNREGSNPMKWHHFEWIIVHFGKILFNEQQRRRVVGSFVPRQGEFANPAMLAADGILRAIQRTEEELKVLPFEDLKVYDRSTILDYVRTFWERVVEILPNMEGMLMYMNEKHRLWYIDAYDAKYKGNNDYTGPGSDIRYYSPKDIVWVPNLDLKDYKMWITTPGNAENYEEKENEMYAFYFQQDLEILIMASWWKEGSGILAPGVPYPNREELEKAERVLQFIFTNYPVTELAPNATTIDGKLNREYLTGINTAASVIADIVNGSREKVYKIICGDIAFPSEIKKAGAFSKISADWKGVKVGDYIKVYQELHEVTKIIGKKSVKVVEPTGNWLELERKAY